MMAELKTILRGANIQRAVVVDDGYDDVPLAKDLALQADDWNNFFDDLTQDEVAKLVEVYPRYDEFRADALSGDNAFVATLWRNQMHLRQEIIEPLFAGYISDKNLDRGYLKEVTDFLTKCGLACETVGRSFEDKAEQADLVIIDLFLGLEQNEDAMQRAISGLKRVVEKRPDRPPLVILMSRSPRLRDNRSIFREQVGLFESAFRVVNKTDLKAKGKLQRILTRLASHYPQSIRLAAFLNAWKTGLATAAERTAQRIRTLDLPDHAQIKNLLLNEEQEPSGSYIVDIFDRVLQHEVEGESAIISAALDLNELQTAAYPPLYISGSRDLQSLVYRTLFQNKERLRLANPKASAVSFGDLLRRKPQKTPKVPKAKKSGKAPELFDSIAADDVLLVVTPACDLQRQAAKRCLLLKGTLIRLQRENLASKDHPTRTTVYEDNQGERHLISWNLKHVESSSQEELKGLLASPKGFEIVARLRDSHALELQQKLLATLGRVGLPAPMPATFTVQVKAYLPSLDATLFELPIPALNEHPCVMYQAQRGEPSSCQLVFTEDACEAICQAIGNTDLDLIHERTRPLVKQLPTSEELLIFERSIDCSKLKDHTFLEIGSSQAGATGSRTIALLRKNGNWVSEKLDRNWLPKAGLILAITFS